MINNSDEKELAAIKLLTEKSEALGRIPKRTDFSAETACFIKQKLGPWPRALEKAGLKTAIDISSKEKSALKRKRISQNKKLLNSEESNE